jgi:RNA polymerase sigma-70 factor (ECF subfamily)
MPVQASGSVETDLALFDRIARRDASAVGELYDRHSRVLHGLIWRILRDTNEAEEVLQDVFVRVWKKADTYDAVLGTPLAWLVRIARNRAIDRLRARRARPIDTADDEMLATIRTDEATAPSPERLEWTLEQGRAVRAALDRLLPEQRVLIEHAFFLGYTQSELAERFGLPLGTVKTRVRAGMLAMREHLQDVL